MAKSFNQLAPRTQLIIFGMLCVLAVAGAWQVSIGPSASDLETRRAHLANLEAEIVRVQGITDKLPQLQREVKALEVSLRETTAAIPEEKDPQDVLRNLHEVASDAALDIASFKPNAIVDKAQYSEWPIQLTFEGGFHDLGRFFDRLAGMARLISVSDLDIKTKTKPNGRGSVTVTCVATTFVFRQELAVPAVTTGTTGTTGTAGAAGVKGATGTTGTTGAVGTKGAAGTTATPGAPGRSAMTLVKMPRLIAAGLALGAVLAKPVAAQVPATTIPIGTKVGESTHAGSYESLNRRDPFLTLVTPRRAASPSQPHLGTGLASFFVSDVTVTGIVKAPGGMMAIVQSVDKQSYVAKVKDRLADAVIKSIDGTSVVFLEVPEAGSFAKPREIRKVLHPVDEVIR